MSMWMILRIAGADMESSYSILGGDIFRMEIAAILKRGLCVYVGHLRHKLEGDPTQSKYFPTGKGVWAIVSWVEQWPMDGICRRMVLRRLLGLTV